MAPTTAKRAPGRPRKTMEARAVERDAILKAARQAIHDRGPDISLDDIAAAAAVSKPTIYAHFTDKAGLAEALAASIATELETLMTTRIASRGVERPEDLLRVGVNAFTKFMVDETNLYRFMVRSIKTSDSDVLDSALLRALQSKTAALIQLVFPTMDDAGREVASYAVLGQVFAAGEGWLQHRRFSRRRLVDMLVALFVHGVPALTDGG